MPIYIISDLHVGSGPLDDCDSGCEETLVKFIDYVRNNKGPIELVLNGDSFDFVQAKPWRHDNLEARTLDGVSLCFTQEQSLEKANSILDAHPRVFDALSRLVKRPDARLTILPGNHDADIFWPAVRDLFTIRICGYAELIQERLRWHLGRTYVPEAASFLWIEHGHQYDDLNGFFLRTSIPPKELWSSYSPPILKAENGEERIVECIGTRFLIRFLNELDYRYPFVDNIKPFGRFLSIFQSSLFTLRGGTIRAALSGLAFARYFATESFSAPGALLTAMSSHLDASATLIDLDYLSGNEFSSVLGKIGYDFQGRSFKYAANDKQAALAMLDFVLSHLDAFDEITLDVSSLGIARNDGTLSLLSGFSIDETEQLHTAATNILANPWVKCVVMGHTHEFVDEPGYKNTGSWTRYVNFPSGAPTPTWEEMVKQAESLPLTPLYVLADPISKSVSLMEFN